MTETDHQPTVPPMKDKALKGMGIVFVSQFLIRLIRFPFQIVLANYMSRLDMGIVTISDTLLGPSQHFSHFGVPHAMQYYQDIEEETLLATGFWMRLMFGLATAGALAFAAPYWAAHNAANDIDAANISAVVTVLALGLALASVGFAPEIRLRRDINFKPIAIWQLIATLVSCAVGAGMVIYLDEKKFWGVVAAGVLFTLIYSSGICLSGRRINLSKFSMPVALKLFGYGKYAFLASILSVIVNYYDNWIVSWMTGSLEMVGIYGVAFMWGNRVVTDVVHGFAGVIFPALSKLRVEPERFKRAYLETMKNLMMAVMPVSIGLLVVAGHFTRGILSPKWEMAVDPMRVLCLYAIVRSVGVVNSNALSAAGKPRLVAMIPVIFLAISIGPMIYLTGEYGILGTSLALLGTVLFTTAWSSWKAQKETGATTAETFACLSPPMLCSLVMAGAVWGVDHLFVRSDSPVTLAMLIAVGIGVYAVTTAMVMPAEFAQVVSMAKRSFKR